MRQCRSWKQENIMAQFFLRLLELIFFVGLAGSLVVAIMAFVGDIRDFFQKDRPEAPNQVSGD
jgi:hypothetical protein